eukprot:CAMPEP_0206247688 /NCGR_PEP_ID=MMETSP0047_2-20121206/19952_1 /ASSEMBLY_ACC=CAM_ASM_000192 /TAXON_ID=195065 /ORGANISM="Chroomonas mesostigmatica_cf, Strain CCMP1168" /LENGTH=60 /DNA_ID=CAMNT_0053673247 /DNA_START=321 /DNA_END=504 /DNA_ORIENTATION=-
MAIALGSLLAPVGAALPMPSRGEPHLVTSSSSAASWFFVQAYNVFKLPEKESFVLSQYTL